MEIKFTHALHSKFIAFHYLFFGLIGLLAFLLGVIYGDNWNILTYFLATLLFILAMGCIIWGIANLRALKTGKFPLSDYAVRTILKEMYSRRGLRRPVVMAPYMDDKGEKYIKYYFSVRFPVILFPIEVTVKYDNIQKVQEMIDEIIRMDMEKGIVKVEYIKDENYFPMGIRYHFRDGSVKEMKGELVSDLIFFMALSLRKIDAKKMYKKMKAWGVPGVK